MITEIPADWQLKRWQYWMQTAVTKIDDLLFLLSVSPDALQTDVDTSFPLRVPLPFVLKMEKGNPRCPLLRQILPVLKERQIIAGFSADPLAELAQTPLPGLLHKFKNRVLITVTGACAVHCRFCFRRHFPYQEQQLGRGNWSQYQQYLLEHPEINEVILSGGDPLTLQDEKLQAWFELLGAVPHVTRIRIHSRTPVMIPQRLELAWDTLAAPHQQIILVLHCNHPNELDDHLRHQIAKIKLQGVTVLNQAVLLKGVNDSVETQVALANALFDHGILPYYLHQLDRVAGAAHFLVSDEEALLIHAGMRAALSGYLLPRLVREVPGETAKVTL